MDEPELRAIVAGSLCELAEQHADLLTLGVGERCLVHPLALALRRSIPPELDVDVEYDREGDTGRLKRYATSDHTMVPDIVVHHRGSFGSAHNLLAMEVKRRVGSRVAVERDSTKIDSMIDRFGYRFGVFVVLGTPRVPFRPRWLWRSLEPRDPSTADAAHLDLVFSEARRRRALRTGADEVDRRRALRGET